MLVTPSRLAPAGKRLKGAQPPKSEPYTFQPPVRGWVTNENIAMAQPGGAHVLDNMVPERYSVRVRGGNLHYATVDDEDACEEFIVYQSASLSRLFAATDTAIYDVSNPVDAETIPTAAVTGQTSGDYSSINMATAGGEFAIAVNGADRMLIYDGSEWRRVDEADVELPYDTETGAFAVGLVVTGGTSTATGTIVEVLDNGTTGVLRLKDVTGDFEDNEALTDSGTGAANSNIPTGATLVPSVTGVDTSAFSHVWLFKSRVFFVRENSLTAHYLPVDSIGGTIGTLGLQGVFQKGGKLVFGASWSVDAGDGMDDLCVFVTDQGEVAVYQGTDPGDANAWSLAGLYQIAKPLHKNAVEKAGGNLLIVTEEGVIPISSVVQKDRAALTLDAISLPIEPTWRTHVLRRPGKWVFRKWTTRNYAVIGFPPEGDGLHSNFIVNLLTGAWARFTGWDIRCAVEFNNELYLGTSDGRVTKAEGLGSDCGDMYSCLYIGLYERLGSVAQEKVAHMSRATWKYSTSFEFRLGFTFNYETSFGAFPPVAADNIGDLWDVGIWDVAVWDAEGVQQIMVDWQSVSGRGFVVAPVVQLTMGVDTVPDVQLISIDLLYETGGLVT